MELNTYKDTWNAAQIICENKLELGVETEFLIPDYLPQVFKVVKCLVVPVILQKQFSQSRISIDGYLRCIVFYQAQADGGLCQTEQKIPFNKQTECKSGEYDFSQASIDIYGEIEYVNCRALSERRIEVRGSYALMVRAYAYRALTVITAMEGENVYPKMQNFEVTKMTGCAEKTFTAQDEIVFEQEPETILYTQYETQIENVTVLSQKAVVKGQLVAQVLYRTQADDALKQTQAKIPFHEILDLPNVDEQSSAFASVKVCSCNIEQNEEGQTQISITVQLYVKTYWNTQMSAVKDVFSSAQTMEIEKQDVGIELVQEPLQENVTVTVSGEVADAKSDVILALATPMCLELLEEQEHCVLRGRAMAHVFCQNEDGEIDCYDKICEYTVNTQLKGKAGEVCMLSDVQVLSVHAEKSGAQLSAQIGLRIQCYLSVVEYIKLPYEVTAGEPYNNQENAMALSVYYAQAQEEIYEIAKHYRVSPQRICQLNEISQTGDMILQKPQRLLIARDQ